MQEVLCVRAVLVAGVSGRVSVLMLAGTADGTWDWTNSGQFARCVGTTDDSAEILPTGSRQRSPESIVRAVADAGRAARGGR